MAHWGVVGGGLLGMTLALRLRQRGHDVTLVESADRLGGLASPWTLGDVVWDRHYHVMLLSDSNLRSLLSELGLEAEATWTQTRTGFYSDGQLYSMSNTVEFLRFPPLSLIEKLRLGGTIFYASRIKNWRRLEDVLVADWLSRWSGRGTFDKIWLPLLRAKLGSAYERTSAAFIWATIARMYAARRSGLKQEMFGYVRGGYARILERFEQVLRERGVAIRLSQPVQRVQRKPDGLNLVYTDAPAERFDELLLTVPAPWVGKLCPDLTDEERSAYQAPEYLGIICPSLLLNRPLSPYYITNITDAGLPFTAVIEMSALVDKSQFGGRSLIYLPKYVAADDALFEASDQEITDTFFAALQKMHPDLNQDQLVTSRISRVRHVFALSTLGYSRRLPPMSTSVPGLHVVNSSFIVNGTLNVNETLELAHQALARVAGENKTAAVASP